MSEELKPQAQNNAEATTNAQAKPAAEVSAAAKPAPAKPVCQTCRSGKTGCQRTETEGGGSR